MTKILVLYYSMYGHVEKMAQAVAEGARDVEGATADIRRAPDLMSEEDLKKAGAKLDQAAPVAEPGALADYDALIVGAPTRYGNMCAQMRNFFDRTGGLWQRDALVGKVASAFTSTATQHGGQETTLITAYITLLHLGYVIAGLPYSYKGQMTLDEIVGGSPYGAATIAGGDGGRQPSGKELSGARYQGRHVAMLAKKLTS